MTFLYLDGPTSHPEPLRLVHYCIIIGCFIAYLLRNVNGFKWIWFVIKCFFLALSIVIIGGQIKKGLKDWLNKD